MATIKPSYGSASALTVTNLQSLANNSFWQSAGQDNDTDLAKTVDVFVTLGTTTTVGSATGYANVYVAPSADGGSTFAGAASGSEGSYAPSPSAAEQSKNLVFLGRIAMKADETTARTYSAQFTIGPDFDVPKNYSLVIENQTGAALASSGNAVGLLKNQAQSV
ncbi:MAG: hypothetical protein WCF16_02170 [Alphaproteobacteria bacterium]